MNNQGRPIGRQIGQHPLSTRKETGERHMVDGGYKMKRGKKHQHRCEHSDEYFSGAIMRHKRRQTGSKYHQQGAVWGCNFDILPLKKVALFID